MVLSIRKLRRLLLPDLHVERVRSLLSALFVLCIPLACQTTPQKTAVGGPHTLPLASPARPNASTCAPHCVDAAGAKPRPTATRATRRPSSEAYVSVLQGELHAAQANYPAAIERYREALLYDRDSDTLTLRLGELYALSGDYERSLANAKRVVERTPHSLPGARLYAKSLGLVGESEQAIVFLQDAILQHPTDPPLSELLAWHHIARGELREAEEVVEKWMSFETDSIDGYVTLATLFLEQGEIENALRYLTMALQRNAHAVEPLELQRDLLYAQGAYAAALLTMQRLSAETGDSLRTRQELLLSHLLADELEEGRSLAHHWLLSDNSIQMRISLASAYERAGLLDESLEMLQAAEREGSARVRNALELEVARVAFQTHRFDVVERHACPASKAIENEWQKEFLAAMCAQALHKNGKTQAAAAHLRRALDEAPASWRLLSTWNELATTKGFLLGEHESEERMTRALQISPQSPDVIEIVALWREESGHPDQARALLEKYASQGGRQSELWMALARHFERQGNPFAAIELAEESLAHHVSSQTLNFLAFTMADHGIRQNEALSYAQRAAARAPLEGYILDTLGWTHFGLGQYQEALHFLRIANRLSPHEPEILLHLAHALVRQGEVSEAMTHLEAAEKWVHNPKSKLAERIHRLVTELRNAK